MSSMDQSLQDAIHRKLLELGYGSIDLIPIPKSSNPHVVFKTLEQALSDYDNEPDGLSAHHFVIRVNRNRSPSRAEPAKTIQADESAAIYLTNGELNSDYLQNAALMLLNSGDYSLARNILTALKRSGKNPAFALYGLAVCLQAEGKTDQALKLFEESNAYRTSIETSKKIISLLISEKKELHAAEVIERALKIPDLDNLTRFDLYLTAGNCWLRLQKDAQALRNYQLALELNPKSDEVILNIGSVNLQAGHVSEAKKFFTEALSLKKSGKAWVGLGCCELVLGDKKASFDAFCNALELDVQNPTAVYYLVKLAFELKDFLKAERMLNAYIQSAPLNPSLLYSLAAMQYHVAKYASAQSTIDRLLSLKPDHPHGVELRGLIYEQIRK